MHPKHVCMHTIFGHAVITCLMQVMHAFIVFHACMHEPFFLHACIFLCMHPLCVCMNMHANVPNYMHDACMHHACNACKLQAWYRYAVHAWCMHASCMQCMYAQFRRGRRNLYALVRSPNSKITNQRIIDFNSLE